jgi:hypothetical protein
MRVTASPDLPVTESARAAGDISVVQQLLARGHSAALGNAAFRLSLAGEKLLLRDGEVDPIGWTGIGVT